jgi:hypothetical protein
MAKILGGLRTSRFLLATNYEDQGPDEIVFPEDLSALDDAGVDSLLNGALEAFQDIYGDGSNLTDEQVDALSALTEGITRVKGEKDGRTAASAERSANAAALAEQAGIALGTDPAPVVEEPVVDAPVEDAPAPVEDAAVEDALVASGTGSQRVPLSQVRRPRTTTPPRRGEETPADRYGNRSIRDILRTPDGSQGVDWSALSGTLDDRLRSFPQQNYQAAARSGRRLREQHNLAVIQKPTDPRFTVTSRDPQHIQEVIDAARNEANLDNGRGGSGSLLAAGGWCAPSETIYDLCELETRAGLLSVPEITINRGGINFTQGPDFASIYADTGFCFTEAQDIAGEYAPGATPEDPNVVGDKPCYHVECPEFDEERLDVCGLCITAGLLQARGYPEIIARVLRGALIGHDHRLNANIIAKMVAGSTAVTMPANLAGATAPLLTSIELQVEHLRTVNRMDPGTTLEAVFPMWVHGVVRSDLALRLGLAEFDVSNQRINGWFTQRGISAQFVYDWQDIGTTAASGFLSWPDTVDFLLYPAGTWVKGAADVITLDTIYDSVGLGQNNYTALFTEEGYLMAKMCHDSRVVTVPLCPDGAPAAGVDIDCDGVLVPA